MKKLLLTGALLLTLCVASFATAHKADCHTIKTECGYFIGTEAECVEFLHICFNQ